LTLAIGFVLFGGFLAVFLVDRHRKRHQAAAPIQHLDPNPAVEPDAEPADWPPTR
jgi:hypothetical protein